MNHSKHKGFVLMFVVATMSLLAMMLIVLGHSSRLLLFEANASYLDAASRNLSASGLAWAKKNIKSDIRKFPSGRIPLDINSMELPKATLSIDANSAGSGRTEVAVHTQVFRGRQHKKSDKVYAIQD